MNYIIELFGKEIEIEKLQNGKFKFPEELKKLEGWHSFQPKPAIECIVVAQKPRTQKTIAGQVLDNGCGAVNINECRIPYANKTDTEGARWGNDFNAGKTLYEGGFTSQGKNIIASEQGRFPANLIVQDTPLKGEETTSKPTIISNKGTIWGSGNLETREINCADTGSPNRFYDIDRWAEKRNITLTQDSALFDVPKPSKNEKNNELNHLPIGQTTGGGGMNNERLAHAFGSKKAKQYNVHPTCKPVTLFRYLATLFCQPKGTVLDPFMGSGSTGIAVLQENKKFIGIEQNKEYFKIAQARTKPFREQTRLA